MSKCFPILFSVASVVAITLCLPPATFAQETKKSAISIRQTDIFSTLGSSEIADDKRLQEQKVDFIDSEIYIGDLLEQISKETGVVLTVTDRYHAAGWKLCVSLRGKSLGDTMNALRSAMSFKNAYWTWRRTKELNGYSYELIGSEAQSTFEEIVKKNLQNDYEKRWEETKATMQLSQSERDNAKEGSIPWLTKSPRSQLALRLLTTDLSSEELNDFIHGSRTSLTIPYAKLSKSGKDFVASSISEQNEFSAKHGYPTTNNTEQDVTILYDTDSNKLTPSLAVLVDELGGYTYLGGTPYERKWRAKIMEEYLTRDDMPTVPMTETKFTEPLDKDKRIPDFDTEAPKETGARKHPRIAPFQRRFKQLTVAELADNPSFSFIACLPQQKENMPTLESPYGKTLGALLSRVNEFGIGSKWNSGILLMRYLPGITRGDSGAIPSYAMIRWVNEHYAAAPKGVFPLEDLIYLSTNWSAKEMLRVPKEQYPYLHSLGTRSQPYYEALGKETPETIATLQSSEGLPTNQLSPKLATIFKVDYPTTRSKTLRARLVRVGPKQYASEITDYFDIFDPANPAKPLHQVGFGVSLPIPEATN